MSWGEWDSRTLDFTRASPDAAIQVLHGESGGWRHLAMRFADPSWDDVTTEALASDLLGHFLAVAEGVGELELCVEPDGPWYPALSIARSAEYWAAQCCERLALPVDRPTRSGSKPSLQQVPISLTPELRATPLAVQLCAWIVLLARLSSQRTVVTRVSACAPGLPKKFPLRVELADDPDVTQVVERIGVALRAAVNHPYVPAHVLRESELGLTLIEGSSDVDGYLTYDRNLFDPESAGRFVRHFVNLMAGMVADRLAARRVASSFSVRLSASSCWSRGMTPSVSFRTMN